MKVKTLTGVNSWRAENDLRVSPTKVQEIAVKAVLRACKLWDVTLSSLTFIYNKNSEASASFLPTKNEIAINLAQVRTVRDVVFAIGHEVYHAKQMSRFSSPMGMLFAYQLEVFLNGYFHSPMETEADMQGFVFESRFPYANKVLNTQVPPLFIGRKLTRG